MARGCCPSSASGGTTTGSRHRRWRASPGSGGRGTRAGVASSFPLRSGSPALCGGGRRAQPRARVAPAPSPARVPARRPRPRGSSMSDRTPAPAFAADDGARPLRLVEPGSLDAHPDAAWARATGFKAGAGEVALVPGGDGVAHALLGRGKPEKRARERFQLAKAVPRLPRALGASKATSPSATSTRRRWASFSKATASPATRTPRPPRPGSSPPRAWTRAPRDPGRAEFLARDLINTPAPTWARRDRGRRPRAWRTAGAIAVTPREASGDNFPMIHSRGRAAAHPQRAHA
jgi:leucyl aminopeptidase